MCTVEYQIRMTEGIQKSQERKHKQMTGQVDYSWLAAPSTHKHFVISTAEKLHFENLYSKVKPEDFATIITRFRSEIFDDTPVTEIPMIMRKVIVEYEEQQQTSENNFRFRSRTWAKPSTSRLSSFRKRTKSEPISLNERSKKE
ncbi:Uncharacterised protein r2_g950 [Pycnogonum litorale]